MYGTPQLVRRLPTFQQLGPERHANEGRAPLLQPFDVKLVQGVLWSCLML
jgi:hypothetical protein